MRTIRLAAACAALGVAASAPLLGAGCGAQSASATPTYLHRWVCPTWRFYWYQEDNPDLEFAARSREAASTHLDILNTFGHNVNVRVIFYDADGKRDDRFGLEGIVRGRSVWQYRTDTGPSFPTPEPGTRAQGSGWFEVYASDPLHLAAVVQEDRYTHHPRAWSYSVPIHEVPMVLFWMPELPTPGEGLR